jgi:hypothetical protein
MGSFIEQNAGDNALVPGDVIGLSFGDLFRRYLDKSREIIISGPDGKIMESRPMTDEELGPMAVAAYNRVLGLIDEANFSMPVSPIDYIKNALSKLGVSVDEITGRTATIDYSGDQPRYAVRKTGVGVKQAARDKFNNGEVDVLIINQAGSTGINLHSSRKFKDRRRRNMIIAQPALDINVFMQTLGQVFRTGQVTPPSYLLLFSNLPAEKRPAAVLSKKMGSLNANTTAGKESDTTFKNVPDFLNEYGDRVAKRVIEENPGLDADLGFPLSSDGHADAMRRVTGRIPVLTVERQEELYSILESEYNDLIEQMDALGGSGLEAKALKLDAKLLNSQELTPKLGANKDTPFAEASVLGVYDVKKLGKPFTSDKVRELVQKGQEGAPDESAFIADARVWLAKRTEEMAERSAVAALDGGSGADRILQRIKDSAGVIVNACREYRSGVPVTLSSDGVFLQGVVTRIHRNEKIANPTALSSWKMDVAVADAVKTVSLSFAHLFGGNKEEGGFTIEHVYTGMDAMLRHFDAGQSQSREQANIVTGNILTAYDKLSNIGRIVTFEDSEGNLVPGILLPKDFKPEETLKNINVSLKPDQALEFLRSTSRSLVKSADKLLVVGHAAGGYQISVPASKSAGGRYFLNKKAIAAAGQDFIKSGNGMCLKNLSHEQALAVLNVFRDHGCGYIADNNQERAKEFAFAGQDRPERDAEDDGPSP